MSIMSGPRLIARGSLWTCSCAPLENGDRLDVRRVRKHVHDPRANQPEPLIFHQNPSVSRQTARMTGNIHDSARTPRRHARDDLERPRPRRIEQYPLIGSLGPWSELRRGEQILREKARIADLVERGIRTRLGNQAGVAFDPDDE